MSIPILKLEETSVPNGTFRVDGDAENDNKDSQKQCDLGVGDLGGLGNGPELCRHHSRDGQPSGLGNAESAAKP